jgi:hypothetical protein
MSEIFKEMQRVSPKKLYQKKGIDYVLVRGTHPWTNGKVRRWFRMCKRFLKNPFLSGMMRLDNVKVSIMRPDD